MITYQAFKGKIPEVYQHCINQVKLYLPIDVSYEFVDLVNQPIVDLIGEVRHHSNYLRFKLLSQNPGAVWLDADVKINEFFRPLDNKAHFSKVPYGLGIWAIYCNGNQDIFQDVCQQYENGAINILGQVQKYIFQKYKNRIGSIPIECFTHYYFGCLSQVNEGQIRGNDKCQVTRQNGQLIWEFA